MSSVPEEFAKEKTPEFQKEALTYLETAPATGRQLRLHFEEKYDTQRESAYLALRKLAESGRVGQREYKGFGRHGVIYYLPEKENTIDQLQEEALEYVNQNESAFCSDLSEALKIPGNLASALLIILATERKIVGLRVGWNFARKRPIFGFCKAGHEMETISRYHKLEEAMRPRHRTDDQIKRLQEIAPTLKLEKIDEALDMTRKLLGKAVEKQLVMGRSFAIMAYACFYIACRHVGSPVPVESLASHLQSRLRPRRSTDDSQQKVGRRAPRYLSGILREDIRLVTSELDIRPTETSQNIAAYLPRIVEALTARHFVSEEYATDLGKRAKEILDRLPKQALFGRHPVAVVASVLYIADIQRRYHHVTQKTLASVAGISEVTIRNTSKKLASIDKSVTNQEAAPAPEATVSSASLPVSSVKSEQVDVNQIACSICGKPFTPREPYHRLCDSCYPGTRR